MDINFEKTIMNKRSRTLSQMAQSTRRLNSGYRINSAADDAAGLAVSEKMRSIDVGLRQGLRNISDGMNFLATQDGAEQVINDSLHRLKEIAVEAANGTNARIDREGLDLEYQQILDEIGDITSTGDFNGVPLFDQHLPEYSKFAGEIKHTEFIDVVTGKNSPLVVNYTQNGTSHTVSLSIPSGRYSADEIADIIDDKLYETDSPLIIGVNSDGQFSLQCEGGKVNYITGPGRSLFYEEKDGVKSGYLIGVTRFLSETVQVPIRDGHNNEIKFHIQGDPQDRTFTVNLLRDGETGYFEGGAVGFNYNQLIERMNERLDVALAGTEYEGTVKAIRTTNDDGENVIGLTSDMPITGLAGNFIMLERPDDNYRSVLYDISAHSEVDNAQAQIVGKRPLDSKVNIFRDRNDFFTVHFEYYVGEQKKESKTIRFDLLPPVDQGVHEKDYTPLELVDKINEIIAENFTEFKDTGFVPAEAKIKDGNKIYFESTQFGGLCKVDLIETKNANMYANEIVYPDGHILSSEKVAPSEYMFTDLFDDGKYFETPSVVRDSGYKPSYCTGEKNIGGAVTIDDLHNKLKYSLDIALPKNDWILTDDPINENILQHHDLEFDLEVGNYSTTELVSKLNKQLETKITEIRTKFGDNALKVDMEFEMTGGRLSLKANGENGSAITHIKADSNATAYGTLIQGVSYYGGAQYTSGESIKYKTDVTSSSITYSPGTSPDTGRLVSGNNSSAEAGEVKERYTYKYQVPDMEPGTSPGYVDEVTDANSTPSVLKYTTAGTQFGKDGKALRNIDVKFTVTDGVHTQTYTATIEKDKGTGADLAQKINEIAEKMPNCKVKAEFGTNGLVITTEDRGNNMRFIDFDGGNIVEEAIDNMPSDGVPVDNDKYTSAPYLTLGDASSHFPLTSDKSISFKIGDETVSVDLKKDEDFSVLVSKLNNAISKNENLSGKVSVSTNGGLTIKGREGFTGKSIEYLSSSALPLDKRYIKPSGIAEPGMATLPDADTQLPLTIVDGKCDTLKFDYVNINPTDGSRESGHVDIDLSKLSPPNNSPYNTMGALISDLNRALDPQDQGKVEFAPDYRTGGLIIRTVGKGEGCEISNVDGNMKLTTRTVTTPTPPESEPDKNDPTIINTPAEVYNTSFGELFISPNPLEIVKGRNDTVSVTVNGENVTITLDPGVYKDSSLIVQQLRTKRDPSNGKTLEDIVTIGLDKGLIFRSKEAKGKNVNISLIGTNANIFQMRKNDKKPNEQYRIAHNCRIVGTVDINDIEIHDWDNQMTFTYKSPSNNGTDEREVTIEIPAKTYKNADELKDALQTAIDDKLGENQLKVINKNGRIRIVGATITDYREIYDFHGRLYDRILQTDKPETAVKVHDDIFGQDGNQFVSYILGRNPMEPVTDEEIEANTNIIVYPNLNDSFIFDLKYDTPLLDKNGDPVLDKDGKQLTQSHTAKIDLKLPEGAYDRKKMAETITELVREQMETLTPELNPDYFRATIGLAAIGVDEPDNLKMPSTDRLVLSYTVPRDGSVDICNVSIDGIRGNICYRNFYQASDTPRPTTIVGAADISNGVTITPGVNDRFSVGLDGELITIDLPGGYFTADELMDIMNMTYEKMGAGIRASMKGDHLMLYSAENGAFDIDPIMGSASYTLFYGGEKRDDDDDYMGIHSGRRTDSYIWYQKTRLDQHLMRINTTGVTTVERALKAINRLDAANAYLLKWRGLNGANENRSARTYDRNNVLIENLENSESAIRDTDMAAEFSKLQRQQVIQQFQDSMLAQTKETVTDMVLNQLNQKG